MSSDPIDNSRDETRRIENQRQNRTKETGQKKGGQEFAVRYQAKIKNKENVDAKNVEHEKSSQEGDLFARVIQVFKGQDDTKHQDSHESSKRDDLKKEKFKEEGSKTSENSESGEGRSKSVADDGHARVAAKHSSQQDSEGGGGGGQGGQSSGHGGNDQSFSGGQSGFSDSKGRDSHLSTGKNAASTKPGVSGFVKALGQSQGGGSGSQGGRQPQLTPQIVNEIVEHVKIGLNENLETEMEVQLTDELFSGLKIKATQTENGVVLTFICPDRKVREQFLINRPRIHQQLKEKQLAVSRIDITL